MGSASSKALAAFEVLNEIFVSLGAGFLGLLLLAYRGIETNNLVQTTLICIVTLASLLYAFQNVEKSTPSSDKIILITGCDSGLGYSFAHHACELGFTVFAGCLNLDSLGAKELRLKFGNRVRHIEIDVTRATSVQVAVEVVEGIFRRHPQYRLWAVINNAGVMVFGEFEWLTERLIEDQIQVNLTGTFRLTRGFCPLLRKHGGRIITVTSHCALSALPGLAVYGATKAGLQAWNDGLRVELKKYGVNVVSLIPGSFIFQSNIMAKQKEHNLEMLKHFTQEQSQFYSSYFKRYNAYLMPIAGPKPLAKIQDAKMYTMFERAVLDVTPKASYVNEPMRYKIYHTFFKYSPVFIRDYLVVKFMQMPKYEDKVQPLELVI